MSGPRTHADRRDFSAVDARLARLEGEYVEMLERVKALETELAQWRRGRVVEDFSLRPTPPYQVKP